LPRDVPATAGPRNRDRSDPLQLPHELRTVPNAISAGRAIAGPVVMMLILNGAWEALAVALAVMVLAEISDVADGLVARQLDQDTELGGLMDPVCDSLYHLSIFLGLFANGWLPVWMLFVIFTRDLIVPYLTTFARQYGRELNVRISGSLKSGLHGVCQIGIVAAGMGLVGIGIDRADTIYLLATVAMVISALSLIDHGIEAVKITGR
jgi:CDP-diacylglycerol--glycerol-3-phosphate 3-phosphatidyltransferase